MFSLIVHAPRVVEWETVTVVALWEKKEFDVSRKVNFMVSLKSYRIQLFSASCNYKSKMNFQKTAIFIFSKCIVLGLRAMIGRRGFHGFVLITMEILPLFPQLQDNMKLIRRYEGLYYTRLVSYYIIFHFGVASAHSLVPP